MAAATKPLLQFIRAPTRGSAASQQQLTPRAMLRLVDCLVIGAHRSAFQSASRAVIAIVAALGADVLAVAPSAATTTTNTNTTRSTAAAASTRTAATNIVVATSTTANRSAATTATSAISSSSSTKTAIDNAAKRRRLANEVAVCSDIVSNAANAKSIAAAAATSTSSTSSTAQNGGTRRRLYDNTAVTSLTKRSVNFVDDSDHDANDKHELAGLRPATLALDEFDEDDESNVLVNVVRCARAAMTVAANEPLTSSHITALEVIYIFLLFVFVLKKKKKKLMIDVCRFLQELVLH